MKVYFVRHGETAANISKTIQGPMDPLTDTGIEQAKVIAQRLKTIELDAIFSSPLPRCIDTARIISEVIGLPVQEHELLIERKTPSRLVGLTSQDPLVLEVNQQRREGRETSIDWKFEDEESFTETKTRALEVLAMLEQQEGKKVLVVTHGALLRFILSAMLFGKDLDHKEFNHISNAFDMANTGISICEFSARSPSNPPRWRVLSWNDMSHIV